MLARAPERWRGNPLLYLFGDAHRRLEAKNFTRTQGRIVTRCSFQMLRGLARHNPLSVAPAEGSAG